MNPAPLLRDLADITRFLEAHASLHALLSHVEKLELPDGAAFKIAGSKVWYGPSFS